ncbi:MAG: zinc ribbon domain-containing protein [Clostridiales bacterium]|nr:zinc ribbon domain-containing protein [Clostridiales bacterium]
MKCPHCGHWNRASFPRCFRCGTELPQETPDKADAASPQTEGASKVYIQINEEGRSTSAVDDRDSLAKEMKDLHARKRRGEQAQSMLREQTTRQGLAPTGRNVQTMTGRRVFPMPQSTSYSDDAMRAEGNVRPDAIPVQSRETIEYDEYGDEKGYTASGMTVRQMKVRRRFGVRRFTRLFAIVLMAASLAVAFYFGVYKTFLEKPEEIPLQDRVYFPTYQGEQKSLALPEHERVIITDTVLNDSPAHLVKVPGEEGQIIWVKELRRNVPVVGGYASIEVEDYTWYEDQQSVTQETVDAVMTLYLKTSAGEQKPMGQITYPVEIPLSPLELIKPSSSFAEVSTSLYEMQFKVAVDSTVMINGQNYTDMVMKNQDGKIHYHANVTASGNNEIQIVVRAPYHRENSMTVTLYRENQQIALDLAAETGSEWRPGWEDDTTKEPNAKGEYPKRERRMKISATTVSWATVRVLTSHQNLDLTKLAVDGSFSFEPIFDHIGDNTIIIEASAPGYETSVVEHTVYYCPVADIYSRKAWDMNDMYTDYLNFTDRRVANTQIYLCKGTITQILSNNPPMALVKLDSDYDRTVLIRNYTNDTWSVGQRYRIFADAYSVYNGAPWLNGRYSYLIE